MCDEIKLTEELAACEARLAGQAPPPPDINRDQLMYDSGWAACEAHLQQAGDTPTVKMRGRGLAMAWSVASTAIAASLALVLVMQRESASPAGRAVMVSTSAGHEEGMSSEAPTPPVFEAKFAPGFASSPRTPTPQVAEDKLAPSFASSTRTLGSGLLALRRQALMNMWPEPMRITAAGDASSEPADNANDDLLRDVLPTEPSGSIRVWSAGGRRLGESI
jgi:hypothetical protein